MNINSISSYSSFNYANLSNANSTQTTDDESKVDGAQKGKGGAGGPRGPKGAGGPPPGGGKPTKGPDLDSDGVWSKDEVEQYSVYSESELNVSLDVDDIFSTYDTDEDGTISASERENLGKNNALKLSKPEDIMKGMMAGKQMSIPMVSSEEEDDESDTVEALNESFIAQYIEAYQSSNDYKMQDVASLFDFAL